MRSVLMMTFVLLLAWDVARSDELGSSVRVADDTVVFRANATANLDHRFTSFMTPPFWTPSVEQINRLQGKLSHVMTDNMRLRQYRKQIFGYTENGKKVVFVNAFCQQAWAGNAYWNEDFVTVSGGGECYFRAKYDPEEDLVLSFSVNSRL